MPGLPPGLSSLPGRHGGRVALDALPPALALDQVLLLLFLFLLLHIMIIIIIIIPSTSSCPWLGAPSPPPPPHNQIIIIKKGLHVYYISKSQHTSDQVEHGRWKHIIIIIISSGTVVSSSSLGLLVFGYWLIIRRTWVLSVV